MKRCVSCQREIPDPAMHCVFCGSRQELQRTILGHAPPAEAWKGRAPSGMTPQRPGVGAPSPHPFPPGPPASGPLGPGPSGPGPYGQQPFGAPPPMAPGPFGGPGYPPAPARVPVAPTWNAPPAPHPAWTPLGAYAPFEPWQVALRVVCLLFGVLLVAGFLAPRSFDPLIFGWAVLEADLSAATIAALTVAALGLLAAVLALLPVSTAVRAMVAALAGVGAEVAGIALMPHIEWRTAAYAAGVLIVCAALLVRAQYRAALLGRIAASVAAVALLLTYAVPIGGEVPVVSAARMLGTAGGIGILTPLLILAVAVTALAALVVVWLPPTTSAAGTVLAWLLLVLPVALLAAPIFGQPDALGSDPQAGYYLVGVLATRALGAYGLACLAGKLLEEG